MNLGTNTCQADLITVAMEEDLWKRGYLGEDMPDKLRTTVYFILGMKCYLRSVQDYYNLRRWCPSENSQITFEVVNGKRCFVYREDSVSKTHDGGLNDMKNDRKEIYVFPDENFNRDPVRLVDKYLGLCPPNILSGTFICKVYANQHQYAGTDTKLWARKVLGK